MRRPALSDDAATRRRLLAAAVTPAVASLAGCATVTTPPTGSLHVRVRNYSSAPHRVVVRLFIGDEQAAAFEGSVRLDPPGEAPYTEQRWPDAAEDVPDETPYRVVALVDGETFRKVVLANCIADEGSVRGYERIDVSIQDDGTEILADDCPKN
jgi:hypothetical protein